MILMLNEPTIKIEVTLFEAALIKKLRSFEYGSITVHKTAGAPRRVEVGTSEMLDGLSGRDLEIK